MEEQMLQELEGKRLEQEKEEHRKKGTVFDKLSWVSLSLSLSQVWLLCNWEGKCFN